MPNVVKIDTILNHVTTEILGVGELKLWRLADLC